MELSEKLAELDALRADSAQVMEGLTREGMGNINLGSGRLEMFIEAAMPWAEGTNEARVDFELAWEKAANTALTELRSQVVAAKLTQGISMVPPSGPNGHGVGRLN